MGWKIIDAYSKVEATPWVSIGVHAKPGGGQIKITMSQTITEHLGVADGDRVMVSRGMGDHEGWLQIQKSPSWYEHGMTLSNRKTKKGNLFFRTNAAHFGIRGRHSTKKITTDDAALILTYDTDLAEPAIQVEMPEEMR
jgi:hypothetical protein